MIRLEIEFVVDGILVVVEVSLVLRKDFLYGVLVIRIHHALLLLVSDQHIEVLLLGRRSYLSPFVVILVNSSQMAAVSELIHLVHSSILLFRVAPLIIYVVVAILQLQKVTQTFV